MRKNFGSLHTYPDICLKRAFFLSVVATPFEFSLVWIKIGVWMDLVTVFDAILTSRQMHEKLQSLYENLMSNNLRRTAVLKKISIVN